MHKVLVPIDGSDSSMRALQYAIRLAKENATTELHIVNAHEPPIVYGEIAVYLSEEKAREFQRQHSEDILKPAIEMARVAGIRFATDILVGNIAKVISRRAEEIGCDSIIMGTHGMGAIANLLMGSIATKVIHLTHLPVTLVK
jgi:nucleotide-binding universal stress UspA family protein